MKYFPRFKLILIVILISILKHPADASEDRFEEVVIHKTKINDQFYMLQGKGGNIALVAGSEGVVMVDDQFAPLSERILETTRSIFNDNIRFIINTHHHGDHTGGNENFGQMGSTIISHINVRKRLLDKLISTKTRRDASLPVVTFRDELFLHAGGVGIRISHVPAAHTDGDALVWFDTHNAVHMGDLYFSGKYPYIDIDAGGSIDGLIVAIKGVIPQINSFTTVIPGHGDLSNREGLEEYLLMLETIRSRAQDQIKTNPESTPSPSITHDFDALWGGGFISAKRFLEIVFRSLRDQ